MKFNTVTKITIIAIVLMTIQACKEKNVSVILVIVESELGRGRVVIDSLIDNGSEQEFIFIPWNTPFDHFVGGPIFNIVDSETGNPIKYRGRMVKRKAPDRSDYIVIQPGERMVNRLDITNNYLFCSGRRYKLINEKFRSLSDSEIEFHQKVLLFDTPSEFNAC